MDRKKGWLKSQPPLVLNRTTARGLRPARLSVWEGTGPDGSRQRGVRGAQRALLKPFALVHYGRISV